MKNGEGPLVYIDARDRQTRSMKGTQGAGGGDDERRMVRKWSKEGGRVDENIAERELKPSAGPVVAPSQSVPV